MDRHPDSQPCRHSIYCAVRAYYVARVKKCNKYYYSLTQSLTFSKHTLCGAQSDFCIKILRQLFTNIDFAVQSSTTESSINQYLERAVIIEICSVKCKDFSNVLLSLDFHYAILWSTTKDSKSQKNLNMYWQCRIQISVNILNCFCKAHLVNLHIWPNFWPNAQA